MSRPDVVPMLPVAALVLALAGCRQDMHNQPRYKPLAASDFFADGRSARPAIAGTVARGQLRLDPARYTGKVNNMDVDTFPFPITAEDLARGQERYNIFCSPCHSRIGDGNGMVVRRGYRQAANYHTDKLRNAPVGHFFDVITNGFGAMPSYAARVEPDDRWRIIAYIRVLQFSQNARLEDAPPEERTRLERLPPQDSGPQPPIGPTQPAQMLPPPAQQTPGHPQPELPPPGQTINRAP
jgi:mono/diheme cytochrome c family protein